MTVSVHGRFINVSACRLLLFSGVFSEKFINVRLFFLLMVRASIFIVCLLLVFINGCTEDYPVQESVLSTSDTPFIFFEVSTQDYGNQYTTFDINSSHDDLFAKWQKYNEQEMKQDEWDAVMRTDDGDDVDDNESVRRGSGVPVRDY